MPGKITTELSDEQSVTLESRLRGYRILNSDSLELYAEHGQYDYEVHGWNIRAGHRIPDIDALAGAQGASPSLSDIVRYVFSLGRTRTTLSGYELPPEFTGGSYANGIALSCDRRRFAYIESGQVVTGKIGDYGSVLHDGTSVRVMPHAVDVVAGDNDVRIVGAHDYITGAYVNNVIRGGRLVNLGNRFYVRFGGSEQP